MAKSKAKKIYFSKHLVLVKTFSEMLNLTRTSRTRLKGPMIFVQDFECP